jgi:hypothetical protein
VPDSWARHRQGAPDWKTVSIEEQLQILEEHHEYQKCRLVQWSDDFRLGVGWKRELLRARQELLLREEQVLRKKVL